MSQNNIKPTFLVFISLFLLFSIPLVLSATSFTDVGQNFQIEIINSPSSVNQGSTILVTTEITNIGSSGDMRIECGIYDKSTLVDWGIPLAFFFPIRDTANCIAGETNVDTYEVSINAGMTQSVPFSFKAPTTDASLNYYIFCDAHLCCYADCPGNTGLTDYEVKSINLLGNQVTESCSDGIKNQDETDTDCGGVCQKCYNGYKCKYDNDCRSNICSSGICTASGGGTPEPNPDEPIPSTTPNWFMWLLIIVGILIIFPVARAIIRRLVKI